MKIRLAPDIMACFTRLREQCDTGTLAEVDIMGTLVKLAEFLDRSGQWNSEYELRLFAHQHYQQQCYVDMLEVLDSLDRLGSVLLKLGKYEAVEKLFRRALDGYEGSLVRTHPYTLTSV